MLEVLLLHREPTEMLTRSAEEVPRVDICRVGAETIWEFTARKARWDGRREEGTRGVHTQEQPTTRKWSRVDGPTNHGTKGKNKKQN